MHTVHWLSRKIACCWLSIQLDNYSTFRPCSWWLDSRGNCSLARSAVSWSSLPAVHSYVQLMRSISCLLVPRCICSRTHSVGQLLDRSASRLLDCAAWRPSSGLFSLTTVLWLVQFGSCAIFQLANCLLVQCNSCSLARLAVYTSSRPGGHSLIQFVSGSAVRCTSCLLVKLVNGSLVRRGSRPPVKLVRRSLDHPGSGSLACSACELLGRLLASYSAVCLRAVGFACSAGQLVTRALNHTSCRVYNLLWSFSYTAGCLIS